MKQKLSNSLFRVVFVLFILLALVGPPQGPAYAAASLTITPITWNVIGLDSNNVDVGPNHFPIGALVCNTGDASATNVAVSFSLGAGSSYINLRPGTASSYSGGTIPATDPDTCVDYYFEVEVTRNSSAYNTTRPYTITATADGGISVSTPSNRELFVEHLISQSRNSVTNMQLSTDGGSTYNDVAAGGTMTLVVGNTYFIKLYASTATNGYEQIETFINFPNTIFQVVSASTDYTADTSPRVDDPSPYLYGDSCGWVSDTTSYNYRSCIGTGKNGGNIIVTYQIKILSVPGAPLVNPEPLSTLVYDFSGSSYHYNADFSASTRFAKIVSPASISKSFSPKTIAQNAVSTLTFTITNTSTTALSGLNFADTSTTGWPTGLTTINSSQTVSYTGCSNSSTPSPSTVAANSTSFTASNISIAASGTCTISFSVTAASDGIYPNTTGHLFIGTSDTGNYGQDTLVVTSAPVSNYTCAAGTSTALATWDFGTSAGSSTATIASGLQGTVTAPDAGFYNNNSLSNNYGTPGYGGSGYYFQGTNFNTTTTNPAPSPFTPNSYFYFSINTDRYIGLSMTFYTDTPSGWQSANNNVFFVSNVGGQITPNFAGLTAATTFKKGDGYKAQVSLTPSTSGYVTNFYFSVNGAAASTDVLRIDHVVISGCLRPNPPQISKSFSSSNAPIIKGNTTTLTFSITNPNGAASLSGISFTDVLPNGLTIANGTYSACGGTNNVTATASTNTITMTGGSLAASGSCSFGVTVTGARAGTFHNKTTAITAAESGPNKSGIVNQEYGDATITVVDKPVISKSFDRSFIYTSGSGLTPSTSVLTFRIQNPDPAQTMTSLAFTDTLPSGLTVASNGGVPTCGGTLTTTAPTGISFSGGSLTAGNYCTFSVTVTGVSANAYTNTTSAITGSATVSGTTLSLTGNTATAYIQVRAPTPSLTLKKQVGASSSGPWYDYLRIPAGNPVWYKFTVENTGDLALNPVTITEVSPSFSVSCNDPGGAAPAWTNSVKPLPVAVAANENHISECVVQSGVNGGVAQSGTVTNTAYATGTYGGGSTVNSPNDTAKYDNDPATPLPVTVSYFRAQRQGGSVDFEWSTSTEAGNLGFNLYVEDNGDLLKLNDELIVSYAFDTLERQDYAFSVNASGNEFYVEDISVLGESRLHGPFHLGQEYGERFENEAIDQAAVSQEHAGKYAEAQAKLKGEMKLPAAAFLPETAGTGELQLTTSLNLKVNRTGIYRVTYEMLKEAGLDLAGVPLRKVTVTNQGQQVPIYVEGQAKFGPGAFIEFYGQALDTLYTDTNVYTIQVSQSPAQRMHTNSALPGKGLVSPSSFMDTFSMNRQRGYVFSSPSANNDPWYDTALLTSKSPKAWQFPFDLADLANSGEPASLELAVWGATLYAQNPDHHLVVRVNDVTVAEEFFDGNMEKVVRASIPVGVLQKGTNTLELLLPGDTGAPADMLYFDRLSVNYLRSFQAQDGQLQFTAKGKAFTVTNLPTKNVLVYQLGENGPERLKQAKVTPTGNTFTASFAGDSVPNSYIVTTAENLYTPAIEAVRLTADLSYPAEFLIISHPDFISGLEPLVQARRAQGMTVSVVDVNDIYAQYSFGVFDPQAIKDYIAYATQNLGTKYVLLVGGDTYDYRNYLGQNSTSFIPSLYAPTGGVIRHAPVDPLYTDLNGDQIPDLAIGRFPVRTTAQLDLMVQKTLSYGQKDYRRTSVFVTDKQDKSLSFKAISASMIATMSGGWSIESIDLDTLGASVAKQQLLAAMNRGTALITYTGHSGASEWTANKLFNTIDASELTNFGRPFVVVQWGCWNTYYIHPTNNYLVQSFLFSGDQGAAVVLGASTLTDSTSETMLGELLTPRLIAPEMPVGQALQEAKAQLALSNPDLLDVLLGWTLMGDPTLVVEP